jgi:hypothetical protein
MMKNLNILYHLNNHLGAMQESHENESLFLMFLTFEVYTKAKEVPLQVGKPVIQPEPPQTSVN